MQIRLGGEEGHCKAELNDQNKEAQKEFKGGIKGDGQEFSKENKLRNINVFGDVPLPEADLQLEGQLQVQEQHQGLRICWERILPQRCLRVLLVEDDDSTRQVVSALLRHCSYEVTAVANGLQAWDLLEDPSNIFELVLTEVVMPCLSGIGLLSKIMSRQTCKNIPVIMMSSHDSIGIVFKCLTMGAVDFLIKPVRKNELKNIWKHVWKRRHNSSGSGCGSGSDSQTQKAVRPKSATGSGNNIGSNEESNNGGSARQTQKAVRLKTQTGASNSTSSNEQSDNAGSDLKIRDGSDNGSGTQGMEEDPHQRGNYEIGRHHSSTCAQVIESKKEKHQNDWMQLFGTSGECEDKKVSDYVMGQDLEIATPREAATDLECFREEKDVFDQACLKEKDVLSSNSGDDGQTGDALVVTCGSEGGEPCARAIDLIGAIARKPEGRHAEAEDHVSMTEVLGKGAVNSQEKDKTVSDSNFVPLLELSLKRPRPTSDEYGQPENRGVLRQSGVSAFSRYNTKCTNVPHPSGGSFPFHSYSLPKGYERCCMPSGNLGTGHTKSPHLVIPYEGVESLKGGDVDVSTPAPKCPQFSLSCNNQEDMGSVVGSSGQDNFPISAPIKDEMASAPPVAPHMEMPTSIPILHNGVSTPYGAAFHAMFYSHPSAPSKSSAKAHITERRDDYDSSNHHEQETMSSQTQKQSHHDHHHHHYHIQHHHHHHKSHENKQLHQRAEHDEQNMNNSVMMTAPRCGSSSMVGYTFNGNQGESGSNGNGNGSVNKTVYRTNDQTPGQNDHYNRHHHHHVQHHHHHLQSHEHKYEHQHSEQDDQIMNNSTLTALRCGSSNNGQSGSGYESVNASEHGSNNGINGQNGHSNGQSSAANTLGTNGESGTVNGVTSGAGASGGGVDQNRFARREAALSKFRQKRKERCFEKKVRYQSRKRLAEQRPRVRGQFVRQTVCESTISEAD
eukprot:Gb_23159 [translate_table: standard]